MTFGSLFSGIGGMDLGLERAGLRCVWQVEIDDYATRVLEKHWPLVRRWSDVRTFPPVADRDCEHCGGRRTQSKRKPEGRAAVGRHCLECDLIAGGFPCQPVSCAGRRQAERDPRWLWPHFARTVRLLRPRYVLVENVPGLLVPGYGFDQVIGDLAALGFDAEWGVLPACAFGAPHLRERVFVIAYAAGGGAERPPARPRQGATDADGAWGAAADADGVMREARIFRPGREIESLPLPCWGSDKPGVVRASYGISNRVDRIRGLGNAVVPAVAEWIGRRILEDYSSSRSR